MKYKVPISVVMPCFNSEKYISDAIDSILLQTFTQFEFLIIDDGSTDGTNAKIFKYSDARIRYFRNDENLGNYVARNRAMLQANGKYICVMDSDDIASPERLDAQFKFMEKNPKIGLVGSWVNLIDENGKSKGISPRITDYKSLKAALLSDNMLTHPTIFMRTNFIEKHAIRYDEKLIYASDYDFVVRCARLFPIRNLQQPLLKYRMHDKQISTIRLNEQRAFADQVRLRQLYHFETEISDENIKLHLMLMRGEFISSELMKSCEIWLNKLLKANERKKIYMQTSLYNFFEAIMKLVISKNAIISSNSSPR